MEYESAYYDSESGRILGDLPKDTIFRFVKYYKFSFTFVCHPASTDSKYTKIVVQNLSKGEDIYRSRVKPFMTLEEIEEEFYGEIQVIETV